MRRVIYSAVSLVLGCAAGAWAQSQSPAIFVANNGNAEGSVTSMTVAPSGALTFVQELVTGTTATNPAGNNAYAISIAPSGRLLAVSHATAATVTEKISILRVNADATLTLLGQFDTPDSPLDVAWLSSTRLAVTETRTSGTNRVRVYAFDEGTLGWTLVDSEDTGGFSSSLALHPSGQWLFASQSPLSGVSAINVFAVAPDGSLTNAGGVGMGLYPLGPGVTPDGRFLYAAGGISGNLISAYAIDTMSGALSEVAGMPFTTPDSSPKQCVASPDGRFLFVGHGSASTVRSFAINQTTGALSSIGFAFDVGIQGALGDTAVLRIPGRDLLFFTDRDFGTGNPRGVLSWTIASNGTFASNGAIVDTQGVSPNDLAVWAGVPAPTCDSIDFNNDTLTPDSGDLDDFLAVLAGGPGACSTAPSTGCNDLDFNNDGLFPDSLDLDAFLSRLAGGPCLQ